MKRGLTLFVFLALVLPLAAQTTTDPAAEKIAPLIKENTHTIVHIDLTRIDPEAIFATLDTITKRVIGKVKEKEPEIFAAPETEMQISSGLMMGKTMLMMALTAFDEADVHEIYVLSSMEQTLSAPVVILLPTATKPGEQLEGLLAQAMLHGIGEHNGFYCYVPADSKIVADGDDAATLFKNGRTKARPEIVAALDLQKKSPIRVVFAPSTGMKGMAGMMLPGLLQQMPEGINIKQQDISAVIKDTESVSLGITPEGPRMTFAVQTPSEESAKAMHETLGKLADVIETLKAVQQAEGMGMVPVISIAGLGISSVKDNLPIQKGNRLVQVLDTRTLDKFENELVDGVISGFKMGQAMGKQIMIEQQSTVTEEE